MWQPEFNIDGLLLPGRLSNVNPERYGAQQSSDAAPMICSGMRLSGL